jgi:hypothetical protein
MSECRRERKNGSASINPEYETYDIINAYRKANHERSILARLNRNRVRVLVAKDIRNEVYRPRRAGQFVRHVPTLSRRSIIETVTGNVGQGGSTHRKRLRMLKVCFLTSATGWSVVGILTSNSFSRRPPLMLYTAVPLSLEPRHTWTVCEPVTMPFLCMVKIISPV